MDDKTYNGWTNYATWRVNLEVFDGIIVTDWFSLEDGRPDMSDVAEHLCGYAEDLIFIDCPEGLARDYALAFLSDVDWFQIADAMLSDVEWTEEA